MAPTRLHSKEPTLAKIFQLKYAQIIYKDHLGAFITLYYSELLYVYW